MKEIAKGERREQKPSNIYLRAYFLWQACTICQLLMTVETIPTLDGISSSRKWSLPKTSHDWPMLGIKSQPGCPHEGATLQNISRSTFAICGLAPGYTWPSPPPSSALLPQLASQPCFRRLSLRSPSSVNHIQSLLLRNLTYNNHNISCYFHFQ